MLRLLIFQHLLEKTGVRGHESLHVTLGWTKVTFLKGYTNHVVELFEDLVLKGDLKVDQAICGLRYFIHKRVICEYRHCFVRHRGHFRLILSLMVDVLVTTTLALLRLSEINLAGPRSFF